jgi:type II secretory pathway pseudopilin PulG
MVVVVLIAVMVALIIPEMRGTFEHEVLRSTSRQAVRALNIAYSQSITTQKRHRVRLDRTTSQLVVEAIDPERKDDGPVIPLTDLPGASSKVDPRVTIEVRPRTETVSLSGEDRGTEQAPPPATEEDPGDAENINFFPTGTADAKEMVLHDREGFNLTLRINPTTSRVQVVDAGKSR